MEYITDIGLEIHIELNTKTKIFCGCPNTFSRQVNANTCPVCTGMPGSLPKLNKRVVKLAIAVGLAFDCTINKYCKFDRKNYFYPDNPQNYQISQLYSPICSNGYIHISNKKVRIREIHMEEDAGKLLHDDEKNISMIDYNRSGVPLIEIVTMPDMKTDDEVIEFLEILKDNISYLKASDCKLNEGSMRVDVNLSVRKKDSDKLGTRTEMKNLNSFRAIRRAIECEKNRQIKIIESKKSVVQETRGWNDTSESSFSMRSKEDSKDYRYFPEPDLAPLFISDEWIEDIRKKQVEFRKDRIKRYINEYKIPEYDAKIITESIYMADLFEETTKLCNKPKKVSNFLMGESMMLLKENNISIQDAKISPSNFARFIDMVDKKEIVGTIIKDIFKKVFLKDLDPYKYAKDNNLLVENDNDKLLEIVNKVIADNEKSVNDYHNGKVKAIGYLVGQTMKASKGKANPSTINEMIKNILDGN